MQLNYHLYFNMSGYSIAAQSYVLAMLRYLPNDFDIKVHFLNSTINTGISKNRQQIFGALRRKESKQPQVNLFHSIPQLYRRPMEGKKHIGFCIYETIDPPKTWIDSMNSVDKIITASHFNEGVFRQSGVSVPIDVVPHCFDPELFNEDVKPKGRYNKFTFLSIGTWKNRKNWEMLIKAFYDGFENKDNVCLLIKTDNSQALQSLVHRVKKTCEWRSKETAPIYAEESNHCCFEDIPKIMKKADAYVCPSLGEGFCLPSLHAMSLGIPLIITKYSGPLEYAKENYCTYIQPNGYKTYGVMDGIPQFNNKIWPVLKIGAIRDAMRSVLQNYPIDKRNAAYEYVHNHLTYKQIGPKFIEAVRIVE